MHETPGHNHKLRSLPNPGRFNQPLPNLLQQLNPMLRGWCAYLRPACRAPRSSICTTSCGIRSEGGSDASTAGPIGRN
ncbi:group II intron maturase-specific domain-containing protein [Streptomyces sp. NPDC001393]